MICRCAQVVNDVISMEEVQELRTAAARSSDRIQTELRARGVRYRLDAAAHTERARALEHDRSFRYAEVASRCLGRLDIRHGLQSPPFTDPLLTHNPTWFPWCKWRSGRRRGWCTRGSC